MKFRIKLLVALSFLWAATASALPNLDETSGVASSDLKASSGEILSVNFRYMPVGWGYDLLGISFSASLSADTFARELLIGFSDIKPCETIQEAGLK